MFSKVSEQDIRYLCPFICTSVYVFFYGPTTRMTANKIDAVRAVFPRRFPSLRKPSQRKQNTRRNRQNTHKHKILLPKQIWWSEDRWKQHETTVFRHHIMLCRWDWHTPETTEISRLLAKEDANFASCSEEENFSSGSFCPMLGTANGDSRRHQSRRKAKAVLFHQRFCEICLPRTSETRFICPHSDCG